MAETPQLCHNLSINLLSVQRRWMTNALCRRLICFVNIAYHYASLVLALRGRRRWSWYAPTTSACPADLNHCMVPMLKAAASVLDIAVMFSYFTFSLSR